MFQIESNNITGIMVFRLYAAEYSLYSSLILCYVVVNNKDVYNPIPYEKVLKTSLVNKVCNPGASMMGEQSGHLPT